MKQPRPGTRRIRSTDVSVPSHAPPGGVGCQVSTLPKHQAALHQRLVFAGEILCADDPQRRVAAQVKPAAGAEEEGEFLWRPAAWEHRPPGASDDADDAVGIRRQVGARVGHDGYDRRIVLPVHDDGWEVEGGAALHPADDSDRTGAVARQGFDIPLDAV
jgi:hypothetical protein